MAGLVATVEAHHQRLPAPGKGLPAEPVRGQALAFVAKPQPDYNVCFFRH
jgi:hypothetical protein